MRNSHRSHSLARGRVYSMTTSYSGTAPVSLFNIKLQARIEVLEWRIGALFGFDDANVESRIARIRVNGVANDGTGVPVLWDENDSASLVSAQVNDSDVGSGVIMSDEVITSAMPVIMYQPPTFRLGIQLGMSFSLLTGVSTGTWVSTIVWKEWDN